MNNDIKTKNSIYLFLIFFLFIGLIEWIIGIVLTKNVDILNYTNVMKIYELLIIITIIISIYIHKKIEGTYLSPFMIFYIFFILFNMGQFVMWGFGIHYITKFSSELGVTSHIRYMDNNTLMKILFITLPSLTIFFGGGYFSSKLNFINDNNKDKKNENFRINIKRICIPLLVISYVVSMYIAIKNINIATNSGYTSIYYGEDVFEQNAIIKYISYMFFPAIFATYIGFNCSKKAYIFLTIVALPYIIINLLIGNRGGWIYFVCLWAWCYLNFFVNNIDINEIHEKKKKRKRIIKIAIIAVSLLIVTTIFYKFREIGFQNITQNNIQEVLNDISYIFIKPIFEMGQSARCLGIILQDNLHEYWNGGNTYIASIMAIVLPRIKLFFGFYDGYLDNWFSQTYLNVKNYGLGFSVIAEAYLNGGEFFYPFYMFAVSLFVGLTTGYKNFEDKSINYNRLFISLASTVSLINLCRGSIELSLRKWFYGCVFILILVKILTTIYKSKDTNIESNREEK